MIEPWQAKSARKGVPSCFPEDRNRVFPAERPIHGLSEFLLKFARDRIGHRQRLRHGCGIDG
jgi:hypothetical protein